VVFKPQAFSGPVKVAYVNFILTRELIGVEKKIRQQARLSPEGFDFFILNRFVNRDHGRVKFLQLPSRATYRALLFRKFDLIEKTVDLAPYDLVILRYPFADGSSMSFTDKYRVVSEHHSDEIPELRSNLLGSSPVQTKLASLARLVLEYRYGRAYRKRCRGLIGVTDELRRRELKGLSPSMPSLTAPNGVDVSSIRKTAFRRLEGKTLNLVFVASKLSPWDGLERLLQSLNRYRGDLRIDLHLVGDMNPGEIRTGKTSCKFHGINEGEALDRIFSQMHLGVSTLGLYVKKLREASSLKTREYTARGIPFMLAYDDTDLKGVNPDASFFLKFPNRKGPIDMERVIRFVRRIHERYPHPSDLSDAMRRHAFEHMDWKPKMARYERFCRQILTGL